MNKVNPDNYITIQGWMVSDLELKGNELLVYAIIYGFTQDGEHRFTGGLQYLANWTNSTKQGVQKCLKSLVDQGLLLKEDEIVNGVKFCKYRAVVDGMQQSCIPINKVDGGMQQSLTNNIVNNKINTISKDIVMAPTSANTFQFGSKTSTPTIQKNKTNKDEYTTCLDLINTYTDNNELREKLKTLLDNRVDICGKERHHFYASTFKNYLNDLDKMKNNSDKNKIEAIDIAIRYNSVLKVFEPNTPTYNKKPTVQNKVSCERFNPETDELLGTSY